MLICPAATQHSDTAPQYCALCDELVRGPLHWERTEAHQTGGLERQQPRQAPSKRHINPQPDVGSPAMPFRPP